MRKTTGRCLCGAIRYEFDGEPVQVALCHCESCRRHTSSPVAAFVLVKAAGLRYTRGQPKAYPSSPGVRRTFCADCGSPIAYMTDRRPEIVDLYAGTLGDPAAVPARCHVFAAERLPWFEVMDELPRYAGSAFGAEPVGHGPAKRS